MTYGTEQDEVETFAELILKADHPEKYLKQVSPGDTSYRAAQRWFEQKHDGDLQKYMYVKRVNHLLKSENNQDFEYTNIITYQRYWTPIGVLIACFYEGECCLLEFMDRRALETELLFLKKKLNANFKKRAGAVSRQLGKELQEYFTGERQTFTVPVASIGTAFQLQAWDALKEIPYGTTRSYKGQAEHLGRPTAVRAVANANGKNRICILIPCHRVIGDNGDLRGYAGGLDRKQFLLELEKAKAYNKRKKGAKGMDSLSFNEMWEKIMACDSSYDGLFYTAVKTTKIYCRPSCRSRKPKKVNVEFYDTRTEAMKAGFRACKGASRIPGSLRRLSLSPG